MPAQMIFALMTFYRLTNDVANLQQWLCQFLSWKLGSKEANPIPPLPYRVCFLVSCDICVSTMIILLIKSLTNLLVMSTLSCSQYTFEPFFHLVMVALYTSDPFCHLVMVVLLILNYSGCG